MYKKQERILIWTCGIAAIIMLISIVVSYIF